MISPDQFRFFIDSGAFSAWSRGAQIDLDEYCAFIKSNIDHIDCYANLDVIAGQPGRNATQAEKEEGARKSWANYLYMRAEGLDPIPVFHVGESWSWLQRMLDYGCSYIGLGGMVGSHLTPVLRKQWLDDVFERITDDDGWPLVKVHGFGMTAVKLIMRYPWHSVDSTTWIKITQTGGILLPAVHAGKFVFDRTPTVISVSDRNPKQGEDGKHANSLSPAMLSIFNRWLAECGKTYEEVREHYYHRAVCNVRFFKEVGEAAGKRPFDKRRIRKVSIHF